MEKDTTIPAETLCESADQQPHGESDAQQAHGECCDECKRTCKRNFWTEILRTVVKVSTIVLAALGLGSFTSED